MPSIRLENSNNSKQMILSKVNNSYSINNIDEWELLTNFTKAYLVIYYPGGQVDTVIDKKFIYNQNYELSNDLDFNFGEVHPLGNHDKKTKQFYPFTGSLDGKNHTIKNIKITNRKSNGLFGIVSSGTIKNLTVQNVIIEKGDDNGILIGKAYNVDLSNINITGNISIKGKSCSCFVNYLEGDCKNIYICITGNISGDNISIISNQLSGSMSNISIVYNIDDNLSLFNSINGKVTNCGLITFNETNKPFYNTAKFSSINMAYYFSLSNGDLPSFNTQSIINNSYYRNLNIIIYQPNLFNSEGWIKINNCYYLKDIINYTNEGIINENRIKYYDMVSDNSNIDNFYLKKNINDSDSRHDSNIFINEND